MKFLDIVIENAHEEYKELIGASNLPELEKMLYFSAAIYYNPLYSLDNSNRAGLRCVSFLEICEDLFGETNSAFYEQMKNDDATRIYIEKTYLGMFQPLFWKEVIIRMEDYCNTGDPLSINGYSEALQLVIIKLIKDGTFDEYKNDVDKFCEFLIDNYGTGIYQNEKPLKCPITKWPSEIRDNKIRVL